MLTPARRQLMLRKDGKELYVTCVSGRDLAVDEATGTEQFVNFLKVPDRAHPLH